MNAAAMRRLEKRAVILRTLANPGRLFLTEEPRRGVRCVCELQDKAGGDFSTVSKHLAQLRRAGLLASEKRGLQVYYRLRSECAIRLLECAGEVARAAGKEVRL